jgi:hypothetical protein
MNIFDTWWVVIKCITYNSLSGVILLNSTNFAKKIAKLAWLHSENFSGISQKNLVEKWPKKFLKIN